MSNPLPLKEWKIAVCQAARRGNKPLVCNMLTERGIHIDDVSIEGRSILFFAIQSSNAQLVETLLSYRCNPNQLGPFQELPLCMAAQAGFVDILEVLAAGGADLNTKDGRGNNCLDYLKQRGDRGALLLRLQEATGLVACRLGCGKVMQLCELEAHESSLCERTSVGCPYCHEIFTVNDFADFHDCKQEPFQCQLCQVWITVGQISAHEHECMKTVTYLCKQCEEHVPVRLRWEHDQEGCMERIIDCANGCGVKYKAKERVKHVLNSCSRRVVTCSQCQEGFEHCDLKKHMATVCPSRAMVCRFGCRNVPLKDLQTHEKDHLNKGTNTSFLFCFIPCAHCTYWVSFVYACTILFFEPNLQDLLLWTPYEVLHWLELHVFAGQVDIQLKFRVMRIFCDDYFYDQKPIQNSSSSPKKKKSYMAKKTKTKTPVDGEVGGSISGSLLSSMYRDKLYQLLVSGNISRIFAKSLVDKFGNELRSSCPRGCGAHFLLKDRKEHADFCPHGIATCLRCGSKIERKNMKLHRKTECQSGHAVRWWPKRNDGESSGVRGGKNRTSGGVHRSEGLENTTFPNIER